jgi:hypothetical protein
VLQVAREEQRGSGDPQQETAEWEEQGGIAAVAGQDGEEETWDYYTEAGEEREEGCYSPAAAGYGEPPNPTTQQQQQIEGGAGRENDQGWEQEEDYYSPAAAGYGEPVNPTYTSTHQQQQIRGGAGRKDDRGRDQGGERWVCHTAASFADGYGSGYKAQAAAAGGGFNDDAEGLEQRGDSHHGEEGTWEEGSCEGIGSTGTGISTWPGSPYPQRPPTGTAEPS